LKKLIGLTVILALVFGAGIVTTGTVAAAPADVDATSCGGIPAPNAYCGLWTAARTW
jgi:hypothetical protein